MRVELKDINILRGGLYVRHFRDDLARKTSFEDNVTGVFVRLLSQSDPVLLMIRRSCHTKFEKKQRINSSEGGELSPQEILVKTLIICNLANNQFCRDCKL